VIDRPGPGFILFFPVQIALPPFYQLESSKKEKKAAQSASADRNGPYHSLLLKFNIMHPPGKASSHLNLNCFFTYSTTAREVKTKAALSGKV
jgi:hypothetical protein